MQSGSSTSYRGDTSPVEESTLSVPPIRTSRRTTSDTYKGRLHYFVTRPRNTATMRAFTTADDLGRTLANYWPEYYDDEGRDYRDGYLALTPWFHCVGINALIDTGASVSIISKTIAQRMGATINTLPNNVKRCVESATGHEVAMAGYAKMALYLVGSVYPHKFFVREYEVNEEKYPKEINVALGNDILSKLGEFL